MGEKLRLAESKRVRLVALEGRFFVVETFVKKPLSAEWIEVLGNRKPDYPSSDLRHL
jgi:hypothetical protein